MRPLCQCKQRPAAINYKKGSKTYYRKKCERCLRNGVNYGIPKWQQRGYEKKNTCEKCNYSSKHQEQFNVFHIDGDLNIVNLVILKLYVLTVSVLCRNKVSVGNKVILYLTFKIF